MEFWVGGGFEVYVDSWEGEGYTKGWGEES